MSKAFGFLMSYMRQRGMNVSDTEIRILWLVILLVYTTITLEMLLAALRMSSRRAWRRVEEGSSSGHRTTTNLSLPSNP